MRQERKWRKAGVLLLTAAVLGSVPAASGGPLLAAAAAQKSPVTEYDEETLNKFKDDTLEYWEIPGLIEQYNITFRNQLAEFYYNPDGGTGLTKDQLLGLASELRAEAEELDYDAEDMKDGLGKEAYQEYQDNIKALKKYAKELEDAASGKSAAGTSAIRGLRITRNQQTKLACEKMRNYQVLAADYEIQQKNLEVARMNLEAANRKLELGSSSAEDVISAEEAFNSAQAAFTSAEAALKSGKQDLLTMLGWRYDADPQIMPVPEPDVAKIASFNPETDNAKAIENNNTLYETRNTASTSMGGANAKARKIQDQEKAVKQNLELIYKDLLYKQASYQAAETEFAVAEANKAAADRKNALGMLSKQQYLSEEVTYLTAKKSRDSAGLDLTAAIEEYEWAVAGLLDIGSQAQ